jgi:hypothetical protein
MMCWIYITHKQIAESIQRFSYRLANLNLKSKLSRVLDLIHADELTPRMRSVDDQSLKQDSSDLLLDGLLVSLGKQVEEGAREVVRVTVRIPQLKTKVFMEWFKYVIF